MIAGQQHRGHGFIIKHFRAGVVRAIQQALHERILLGRFGIAQHTGQLPHQTIHQHHRRQLATGQHIVADGNLFIHILANQAFIYAFVTSRQQDQTFILLCHQLLDHRVGKQPALRRQIHHPAFLHSAGRLPLSGRVDRDCQRFAQHHHSGTAAVGTIVDGAVIVRGEIPGIPRL